MTKAVQDLMLAVERVRDAFHRAVWEDGSPDAAVACVADDVAVASVPVGIALVGAVELRRHLADDVVGHLPDDLAFRRVSRTGDRWRVADEHVVSFTHDRELPWLLPGAAPTHRAAQVLVTTVVEVRRDRVVACRMLWDRESLTRALGVEPPGS